MTKGTNSSSPSVPELSLTSPSQSLTMSSSSIPSAIFSRLPPSLGVLSDLNYTRSGRLENAATGRQYFVKLVSGSSVLQTQGEAEGLRAMRTAMGEKEGTFVPDLRVWDKWEEDGVEKRLMISDYHPTGSLTSSDQAELGRQLAKMHSAPTPDRRYGFPVPTHCGVTEQDNTWTDDWLVFWRDRRLGSIVDRIDSPDLTDLFEDVKERVIPLLLSNVNPPIKPSILHGDTWSGNVTKSQLTGRPFIFDCASYHGHAEAEIALCNMFGGFSKEFFQAYHEILPRSSPYYEERQALYEVYHHLNHWLMFGGSYKSGSMRMLRDLVAFADRVEGGGE